MKVILNTVKNPLFTSVSLKAFWLVGCFSVSVGYLVRSLVYRWVVVWSVGQSNVWMVDLLVDWFVVWFAFWLVGWSVGRMFGWLIS